MLAEDRSCTLEPIFPLFRVVKILPMAPHSPISKRNVNRSSSVIKMNVDTFTVPTTCCLIRIWALVTGAVMLSAHALTIVMVHRQRAHGTPSIILMPEIRPVLAMITITTAMAMIPMAGTGTPMKMAHPEFRIIQSQTNSDHRPEV